jgi:hypothetical protein
VALDNTPATITGVPTLTLPSLDTFTTNYFDGAAGRLLLGGARPGTDRFAASPVNQTTASVCGTGAVACPSPDRVSLECGWRHDIWRSRGGGRAVGPVTHT